MLFKIECLQVKSRLLPHSHESEVQVDHLNNLRPNEHTTVCILISNCNLIPTNDCTLYAHLTCGSGITH